VEKCEFFASERAEIITLAGVKFRLRATSQSSNGRRGRSATTVQRDHEGVLARYDATRKFGVIFWCAAMEQSVPTRKRILRRLKVAAAFHGFHHCDFVGVFEIGADRNTYADARDANAERF
jgi:hypothetical protein